MKKILKSFMLALSLCLLFSNFAFAQSVIELPEEYEIEKNGFLRIKNNGKYGYADLKGNVVIAAIYDDLSYYDEKGYLYATLNGKRGVISQTGEVILPFEYEWIIYERKKSIVKKNGKYGVVNENNIVTIPIKYDNILSFQENGLTAAAKATGFGYIDKEGNEITPFIFNNAHMYSFQNGVVLVERDGSVALMDEKGRFLTPFKYEAPHVGNVAVGEGTTFSEGLLVVSANNKEGCIDDKGKEVISIKYDSISSFKHGAAWAVLNGKLGAINRNEKTIVPFIYSFVQILDNGKYKVKKEDKYALFDSDKKMLLPAEYDFIDWQKGMYRLAKENKYGLMDENLNLVVPFVYDQLYVLDEEYLKVSKEGKVGVVDRFGNIVIPLVYTSIERGDDGFAVMDSNNNWKYVDENNKEILAGVSAPFKNGFAIIRNPQEGVVDKNGNYVIPCIYKKIDDVGYGFVCDYGKKSYLKVNHYISMHINKPIMSVDGEEQYIDDTNLQVSPIIINNRTMVPIRSIIEAMGGTVQWENESRSVTIKNDVETIILKIDNNTAIVDGKEIRMDTSPQIIEGRTVIPIRFVAENIGCAVYWEKDTQKITLAY